MAEIFRPTYTVNDPKTGKRTKKKSRTWHIRYYTPDGARHRVKGYRDRKATETLAAELERRGIRVHAGVVDPTEEHAKKPLNDHAEDFRRYLAAKGNTPEYVAKILFRLLAVLDGCRFVKIADIQASALVEFLGALRGQGKGVKTANDYLAAAVESLPTLTAGSGPEAEALPAMGTDGRQICLGPSLGPQPAILGDFKRQAEEISRDKLRRKPKGNSNKKPRKTSLSCRFPGQPARIRPRAG